MGRDDIEYKFEKMEKELKFLSLFKYEESDSDSDPDQPYYGYSITWEFIIKDNSKLAGNINLSKELSKLPKDVLIALKNELKNPKELSKILDKLIS